VTNLFTIITISITLITNFIIIIRSMFTITNLSILNSFDELINLIILNIILILLMLLN
jgi:hypothetical protein